jgi:hypothetical protein
MTRLFVYLHERGPRVEVAESLSEPLTPLVEGDFTGFYDWLRPSQGTVIGVRYRLLEDADPDKVRQELLSAVEGLTYVISNAANATIELFFGSERSYLPALSCDQAFGGNELLRAASGAVMLTFDAETLTPDELDSILSLVDRG